MNPMPGGLSVSSQLFRFLPPPFFDAVSLVQLRCVHLFCASLVAATENRWYDYVLSDCVPASLTDVQLLDSGRCS